MPEQLIDSFGRTHEYLRISLTDKCNFRCTYCMPNELMKFMPEKHLMNSNEIVELTKTFAELGVKKVRFTGGEPTLRKDLSKILEGIGNLNLKMAITTNAFNLNQHLDSFESNGLNDINISIDTMDKTKFKEITKRDALEQVLTNIDLAQKRGFNLKLNVVVIRNFNDGEIPDIINYSAEKDIPVRFIEYMPFFGNQWNYKKVFSQKEMLDTISSKYNVEQIESDLDSTSDNYVIPLNGGRFGIIPTVTNPFCQGCSRIRLTADGKIKNCLFSSDEDDLLLALRNGLDVKSIIEKNLYRKKKAAAGRIDFKDEKAKIDYSKNRSMIAIGG